ncbi:hypothetical protein BDZ90DRAFT_89362 [Jaminaea rosea]|uniref:Uncharacterized protein n=1 Tax=Jaminaea rosea TaxID=1569628 RepID=A0A316UI12_9BASI|nr:hypothetical protein BDZ90DRAFT_89362 [Jaminaea rosea]PWN24936.1 hypothetical protein BDZ90DRAFT_89362 [Jaminaea rosea]
MPFSTKRKIFTLPSLVVFTLAFATIATIQKAAASTTSGSSLIARYTEPLQIPRPCSESGFFCLTVQTINGALIDFKTNPPCGVHQTVDHDGTSCECAALFDREEKGNFADCLTATIICHRAHIYIQWQMRRTCCVRTCSSLYSLSHRSRRPSDTTSPHSLAPRSLSCTVDSRGQVDRSVVLFGYATVNKHGSFISTDAPTIVGKGSNGDHMDGAGLVGQKSLYIDSLWADFRVWCKRW